MNRRTLLQLFGGLAVSGIPRLEAQRPSRIVIAGAGIVGANIAYQLARRGAEVTVLERETPGSGATSKSFAWINATFSKQPWAYFYLNRLGMQGWRHLERDIDGLPVRWGGSIEWYTTDKEARELVEQVKHHEAWGYPVRPIDERALRSLEPSVQFTSVKGASHSEDEGHVDPVKATETILAAATKHGARIVPRTTVTGLDLRGDRLQAVRTSTGDVPADVLVVACGVDTPRVAAFANIRVPLKESPGVLVHTTPQPQLLNRVVLAPGAHMKQKPDGRIVTGVGFGGTPTKDSSREGGQKFLQTAAAGVLPGLAKADLETVTLGFRPLPQDEYPIVGFAPGRRDVYITVMHSGVTLSPFIGRAAAVEILDGVDVEPLAPYRLARFTN
jgi:glycine/D-amino acid oxidase-like deaminating enzyme